MELFCEECGTSIPDGSKFCRSCGKQTSNASAAPQVVAAAPVQAPPPANQQEPQKKGGSFFSTPPGIAIIVVLSVLIIAGAVVGVIFAVRAGANSSVDAATVDVWDEYEEIVNADSSSFKTITYDPTALTKAQEDLKKSQERVAALEKVLAKTGGTEQRRKNTNIVVVKEANQLEVDAEKNARDQKAAEMEATLKAYELYVQKMNELFGTLINANLLDPNAVNTLNKILKELQALSAQVKKFSETFLANNPKLTITSFDAPFLKKAAELVPEIENNVKVAQETERQRIEAEKAAADAAAAAAAEAQRQAEAAAAQERQQQQTTTDDSYDCGDPNCPICHPENQ